MKPHGKQGMDVHRMAASKSTGRPATALHRTVFYQPFGDSEQWIKADGGANRRAERSDRAFYRSRDAL